MKIKKHFLPIFTLILITIVTHWLWFLSFDILTYGDWVFSYKERMQEDFALPALWQTSGLFGSVNIGVPFWPFLLIGGALAKMNFDYPINMRIVFLWPIGLLSVVLMYCLAYYIFRSRIGAWISAIVYGFNAVFLALQTGVLTIQMAMSIAPFLILFFMVALEKKKMNYAIIGALIAFILSFYEFRIFYMMFWILGFYTLYYLIVIEKQKRPNNIFRIGFLAGIAIILPILLNLYWLLGMHASVSKIGGKALERSLFGTSFVNIVRAITFFPYCWTGGWMPAFQVQQIPLRFYLIPIFAFLGFLLYRKKKKIVAFFAFLGLLGVLLVKMTCKPFSNLYPWLFDYLPGFKAFREGTKFYFYIGFSYSILIGAFFAWLWRNWKKKKWQISAKYILTFGIVFLFLWNTKPLITGKIGGLFTARHIPNDYLILKDFILRQPEYFRTLWAPRDSRWGICLNHHPKVSTVKLAWSGKWEELIEYPKTMTSSKITGLFKQDFSDTFLDLASIKYVIVPIQDIENDDDFFRHYGPRNAYIKEISKLSYLKKVDLGTEELLVFENKDFRPHLYITSEEETIYKYVDYQKIDYQFINPTKYNIKLKNLSELVYLNFSESYHPDWKIKVGKFNWFKVLTDKNYFLLDEFHFENNALFNSFVIDPDYIKSHYSNSSYKENPDGSIDVELTLFFRPQSYLYFGLIISITTLVACLGYLIYLKIRDIKRY